MTSDPPDPPAPRWTDEHHQRLRALLGDPTRGGAELEVTDPDGTTAFLAAIARHYRTDGDVLWIRPILGGHDPGDGQPYTFDLDAARRRGLHHHQVDIDGRDVVLLLASGQHARIRRARAARHADLERWDTWLLTAVDAHTEAELDALDTDSHPGT